MATQLALDDVADDLPHVTEDMSQALALVRADAMQARTRQADARTAPDRLFADRQTLRAQRVDALSRGDAATAEAARKAEAALDAAVEDSSLILDALARRRSEAEDALDVALLGTLDALLDSWQEADDNATDDFLDTPPRDATSAMAEHCAWIRRGRYTCALDALGALDRAQFGPLARPLADRLRAKWTTLAQWSLKDLGPYERLVYSALPNRRKTMPPATWGTLCLELTRTR